MKNNFQSQLKKEIDMMKNIPLKKKLQNRLDSDNSSPDEILYEIKEHMEKDAKNLGNNINILKMISFFFAKYEVKEADIVIDYKNSRKVKNRKYNFSEIIRDHNKALDNYKIGIDAINQFKKGKGQE